MRSPLLLPYAHFVPRNVVSLKTVCKKEEKVPKSLKPNSKFKVKHPLPPLTPTLTPTPDDMLVIAQASPKYLVIKPLS
jgi:hypothetical protein